MDEENNSKVSMEELQQFMYDNYLRNCKDELVDEIISEFDSDLDKCLTYDEFQNVFLPAANESMRSYCLYSKKSKPSDEVPKSVLQLAARILEHELTLARHKIDARKDLKRHQGINFKTVPDGLRTLFG